MIINYGNIKHIFQFHQPDKAHLRDSYVAVGLQAHAPHVALRDFMGHQDLSAMRKSGMSHGQPIGKHRKTQRKMRKLVCDFNPSEKYESQLE